MKPIKVMIVDDSAVVRQVLTSAFAADASIEVIGAAADPIFAMEKMSRGQWPDVIVLDVEMPRMDGITFLKKLMTERPIPVVICSSLTAKGAATSIEAMAAGAVSIVTKPQLNLRQFLIDASSDLIAAVKTAARANLKRILLSVNAVEQPRPIVTVRQLGHQAMARTTETLVAIGTSTGGTQALEYVLTALPEVCPGLVIVQHMPEHFTAAFAERLNKRCQIEVREARHGDRVMPGLALIAPGGRHMLLKRSGARYLVEVIDGPPVNRHRPSVDVLFRSTARAAGSNAMGIIMTGMGDDGARGLKEMLGAGARTLGQDENSCVVYGMPREALKIGAVEAEISLQQIPEAILHHWR